MIQPVNLRAQQEKKDNRERNQFKFKKEEL